MKFIAIKNVGENKELALDVVKSLVGNNIQSEEENDILFIYHSYENDYDITNLLSALETEFGSSIFAYLSNDSSKERLSEEKNIYITLSEYLPHGIFKLKEALLKAEKINNKRMILDFILDSTGINEAFIEGFIESNLNVSFAGKKLNFHRNTMNYKLDKFYSVSGFDLRVFKDAYIIYSLFEKNR
jgi:DNA-binding PucR family transcriptional regulator